MESAEEIAYHYGLCTCDEIYTSRGLYAPDCPWHSLGVEEAMEEYAKEVALAFCATEEGVSPESLAANFDRFMKREGMV